jgi:hypothetical protein
MTGLLISYMGFLFSGTCNSGDRFCGLVVRVPGWRTEMYLCFLWGTNWIYICYVEESRPPLWSSGQSSWLQNGDVFVFPVTNWIYICYVEESRPPLWSSGQSSWLQNGDVLCFLWGMNWIYICYVAESRPPLWSSGQSSWLQIQRSGFDSPRGTLYPQKLVLT